MKRSKFAEAQIAFILRQAEEGTVVGEVCRKAGISEATFYNWRKKYHGLAPSEMSGCTSSRRRTANSRRSWRSVALSGTRPTLTEAHWKKAGSLVQSGLRACCSQFTYGRVRGSRRFRKGGHLS